MSIAATRTVSLLARGAAPAPVAGVPPFRTRAVVATKRDPYRGSPEPVVPPPIVNATEDPAGRRAGSSK